MVLPLNSFSGYRQEKERYTRRFCPKATPREDHIDIRVTMLQLGLAIIGYDDGLLKKYDNRYFGRFSCEHP